MTAASARGDQAWMRSVRWKGSKVGCAEGDTPAISKHIQQSASAERGKEADLCERIPSRASYLSRRDR